MSILLKNDDGWVIDHHAFMKKWYQNCSLKESDVLATKSFQLKPALFEIHHQFMMDSQFTKLKMEINGEQLVNRKRKRKSQKYNEDEVNEIVDSRLKDSYKSLITSAQEKGLFTKKTEFIDNNMSARLAGQLPGPGESLIEMVESATREDEEKEDSIHILKTCEDGRSVRVNELVHVDSDSPLLTEIFGEKYLLPAKSSFLMSDWEKLLHTDITGGNGFDLIVIDPPWMNKSVKRKKSYCTVWEDTLINLPVERMASGSCLIVIWVTNKTKLHSFIKETLMSSWNLKYCVEWQWIKITTGGQMICDMNVRMKKPYETLFIGKLNKGEDNSAVHSILPDRQVIISVPCSLHSKKPPLLDILKPYLPDHPKCLELFARNLHPGWTSWGNEVLKHQHIDYYEIT